jgi:hypothetical protein
MSDYSTGMGALPDRAWLDKQSRLVEALLEHAAELLEASAKTTGLTPQGRTSIADGAEMLRARIAHRQLAMRPSTTVIFRG